MLRPNVQPTAAIIAWLAWLASYAVTAYQFFARVIHPHFLPLVSLLFLGCAAGILAMGLGLWRVIRGPRRLAAMGWSLFAAIPILLWAAHSTYAISSTRTRGRSLPNFPLRLVRVAAAAAFDGLARFTDPHRLEGEHTVMIYDECDDPEGDLAAMDRHIEQVGKVLGRPLRTKVYWVRGGLGMTGLLQVGGVSLPGMAVCGEGRPPQGSPDRLTRVDRHEAAHNVILDQLPTMAWPPTVLNEGWAESQSGDSMERRARLLAERGRRSALSLREFFSPEKYVYSGFEAYDQGGVIVDFLLRRYGAEKFFDLCATCRPETIAEDCKRVYGADPDQLDELFWADLRARVVVERPKRQKSISAELGIPDGPNDESARQEFLDRYRKEVETLKEAYRHVRMAAIATWDDLEPKPSDMRSLAAGAKSETLRCGDRVRAIKHGLNQTEVFVAAPELSFCLRKGANDTRFWTEWVGKTPDDGYLAAVAGVRRVTPELDAAYHIGPIDVLEWTRSPGFKITRAVRLQEGSRRLVKVYFEYDRSDQDGRWAEGAGWVSFRPDDCWTVDAYDERSGSPNPFGAPPNSKAGKGPVLDIFINQRTVHYRGKEKGVPVVESLETTRNHVGAWKARETVRVTEIQFDAPPDETFDLASYDAEPPAKEEDLFATITRWLVRAVWVCSAGVVIAAVPAMVRRVVGKKGERMTG